MLFARVCPRDAPLSLTELATFLSSMQVIVHVSLFLQGEAQMNTEGRGGEEKERNAQDKVFTIRLCFYSLLPQTKPCRFQVGVIVLPMP